MEMNYKFLNECLNIFVKLFVFTEIMYHDKIMYLNNFIIIMNFIFALRGKSYHLKSSKRFSRGMENFLCGKLRSSAN